MSRMSCLVFNEIHIDLCAPAAVTFATEKLFLDQVELQTLR